MTDLKKLRELAEKANPGPWIEKRDPFDVERIHVVDQDDEIICYVRGTTRNSYFIATANPQAIIELLDRLERYEKALRFYGNEKNWDDSFLLSMSDREPTTIHDECGGRRAREALEGGK